MRPIWSVNANGQDISARLAEYLISISVTDQAGMESDELELSVADPERRIAMPELGTVLEVALGYAHSGSTPLGRWVLDSLELDLAPRAWTLRGHAADLRGGLRTRRSNGFEDIALANIVAVIADRNGLKPLVGNALQGVRIERLDQTNESDISFLTRLGQMVDAIVTVKSGYLIVTPRGQGLTAAGQAIPTVTLKLNEISDGQIRIDETEIYDAVEARYRDLQQNKDLWVRAGAAVGYPGEGSAPDNVLRLRGVFPTESLARTACAARLSAQARRRDTLRLALPGRTDLAAETPLNLEGVAPEFDGRWVCSRVAHRLDAQGYRVEVEAERPPAAVNVEPVIPAE